MQQVDIQIEPTKISWPTVAKYVHKEMMCVRVCVCVVPSLCLCLSRCAYFWNLLCEMRNSNKNAIIFCTFLPDALP